MPRPIDLLVHNAAQIVTCASRNGPKRRGDMADAGILKNAAIAVSEGLIVEVGDSDALRSAYSAGAPWMPAAGSSAPASSIPTRIWSLPDPV